MIKTSSSRYITITKQNYENEIAIPTGRTEENKAEVYVFMSRNPERFIWIERHEISANQHPQITLWKN